MQVFFLRDSLFQQNKTNSVISCNDVPNLYDFLSSVKYNGIYLDKYPCVVVLLSAH